MLADTSAQRPPYLALPRASRPKNTHTKTPPGTPLPLMLSTALAAGWHHLTHVSLADHLHRNTCPQAQQTSCPLSQQFKGRLHGNPEHPLARPSSGSVLSSPSWLNSHGLGTSGKGRPPACGERSLHLYPRLQPTWCRQSLSRRWLTDEKTAR